MYATTPSGSTPNRTPPRPPDQSVRSLGLGAAEVEVVDEGEEVVDDVVSGARVGATVVVGDVGSGVN
jgi:hypothetical protein